MEDMEEITLHEGGNKKGVLGYEWKGRRSKAMVRLVLKVITEA